jgi:hypothetical protein
VRAISPWKIGICSACTCKWQVQGRPKLLERSGERERGKGDGEKEVGEGEGGVKEREREREEKGKRRERKREENRERGREEREGERRTKGEREEKGGEKGKVEGGREEVRKGGREGEREREEDKEETRGRGRGARLDSALHMRTRPWRKNHDMPVRNSRCGRGTLEFDWGQRGATEADKNSLRYTAPHGWKHGVWHRPAREAGRTGCGQVAAETSSVLCACSALCACSSCDMLPPVKSLTLSPLFRAI